MSTSYQHEDIDGMGLAKEHKLQREIDQQNRDSEINRAMAEVAGWELDPDEAHEWGSRGQWCVPPNQPLRCLESRNRIPNFLLDLNAVAQVETSLPDDMKQKYWWALCAATGLDAYEPAHNPLLTICATAHQRCTAILKTLNRWNPEWDYPI
jgi:hypothetical protein